MRSPVKQSTLGRGFILLVAGLAFMTVASLVGAGYTTWLRVNGPERPVAMELLSGAHDPKVAELSELRFYTFDPKHMATRRETSSRGEVWYEIQTQDPTQSGNLGMALIRDMPVDRTGVLEIQWRGHNTIDRLSLNLIEKPMPGRAKGAIFTRLVGALEDDWTRSLFPVTSFEPANFQDPANLAGRKNINPRDLMQLDLVVLPGKDLHLGIRSIRMLWDPYRYWMLGCAGLLALLLLASLPGSYGESLMQVEFPKGVLGVAVTSRLTLLLTLAYWSILSGQGQDPGPLGASLALAVGTAIASIPGTFPFCPPIRHRLWGIRNFLVWSIAIVLGLKLSILAAGVAILIILLPCLESRDYRITAVNGVGVIIGILAILPFELAGNRILPALLASGMVAVAVIFIERIGFAESSGSTASILKLYQGLFHHSPDGIFVCDLSYRIQTVNPGFLDLVRKTREELEGIDLRTLVHEEDINLIETPWEPEEESRSLILRYKNPENLRYTLTRIQQLTERGRSYGFQAISADITREKELEEELRTMNERLFSLSRKDALTNVSNRRAFDERMEQEWLRAIRHKNSIAVALVDIDHFKAYNDTYGHPGGDLCLQQVAACLATFGRRSGEMLARYGGEEFAFVLPQLDARELQQLCEQIVQAIDALAIPHSASPVAPCVSISIGAAWRRNASGTVEDLIAEADEALYCAKAQGRRRAIVRTETSA